MAIFDKEIDSLIKAETKRQQLQLDLIASENHVSPEVMKVTGSIFTNKYSEGYPLARYYAGQENIDKLELLCQYRALKMMWLVKTASLKISDKYYAEKMQAFLAKSSWWVNVQPLSGSPANVAVYLACLKPWDTILGMDLSAWGHLTHGHKLSASGILYNIVSYGVSPKDHRIDYKEIEEKALKYKPALIIAGFSAYSRNIEWKKFADIAKKVQKKHGYTPLLMADIAHIAGLVAWWAIEGPFKDFDIVTTTTHKTLRWPRGGLVYYKNDARNLGKAINRGVFPWIQWGPHVHTYAAKAVVFQEAMQPTFKAYAKKVIENTKHLAQELHDRWWNIMTEWTDNHIILMDVTQAFWWTEETEITWTSAQNILESIGITVNKNMIPFDPRSPMDPSGIRMGAAALTTRWMWKKEMSTIATIIELALLAHTDKKMLKKLQAEVIKLAKKFPLLYK